MSTVAERLIAAKEFAEMPDPTDGSQQELVRGVIIAMPPPKGLHGAICTKVASRLSRFVERKKLGHVFCNDTGVITGRDPDTVRGVDIGFWSYKRLPRVPDSYIEVAADLLVEVLSPKQTPSAIEDKIKEYFELGVPCVWVVVPKDRAVWVFHGPEDYKVLDESKKLRGEGPLRGFLCNVADLFP